MSPPNVTLRYFPLRARAELIRLILEVGNIKYEEDLITFADWPKRKPDMTPFHAMPVLVWNEEEIAQSLTIARYVARKVGLAGDGDEEMARADMIAEQCKDAYDKYIEIRFCKNEVTKKELTEQFVEKVLSNFLTSAEKLLNRRGGQFFTGGGLSYGDLSVYALLDTLADSKEMSEGGLGGSTHEEILKMMAKCPLLTDLHKAIREHPKIATHIKQRPAYAL